MKESIRNATGVGTVSNLRLVLLRGMAIAAAALPTAVSFCVAAYAGWSRGATPVQRMMSVAMAGVAVLYVHWALTAQRSFSVPIRVAGAALWCAGLMVLMFGQVTFFIESRHDAGNRRAALVQAVVATRRVDVLSGRSLAEIAEDRIQVVTDLARTEARRCIGSCPAIAVRKAKLGAQLAALDAEMDGVKRREVEDDHLAAQAERADALRESQRADPVVSQVAAWVGTTEPRLELAQAAVFAVVLEGAAIMGWLWVAQVCSRTSAREPVAPKLVEGTAPVACDEPAIFATGTVEAATPAVVSAGSDDDCVLGDIHAAVTAGRLKPTQAAIREFLECGQATAGRFARLYRTRIDGAEV
ncbi:hypothetical protein CIC12_10645 [Burkholderia sp. SG-MS1]|uniref:hypothetical protein n=1 Tax=Paraburkholderia sp. SG-MS1 TaxID=2023741 RepID=UPI001447DAE8|nr:hypothetical protein [Paraburkholderia sp. SG-MS1]NKJ47192.1 hypothetical protein [Paraburkholderia sp. SG-MS1]